MKKIGVVFLLVLFILSAHGSAKAQSEAAIETIRQHYAAINKNVTLYRRVKKDLSGYSAEGGELIAYFHGPTIMKIAATFFGETGKSTEEYYYWDGKLIFVFRREARYDKPLSGKIVATKDNRFYFKDDKMIRWIDENGKEVAAGSTEFPDKEKEYLKSSKEFNEGARSKSQKIEAKE